MSTSTGYLGLGANLGDRRAALQGAVDGLRAAGVEVLASSSTYATDPVGDGPPGQPDFLNACLRIRTELRPRALLDLAKALETDAGRELGDGYVHHGPRPLDVDVLLLGAEPFEDERLTIPHAALAQRRFVLIPLLELDLELALPDGRRLHELLAVLPTDEDVRREGPPLRV